MATKVSPKGKETKPAPRAVRRLKTAGIILTVLGLALFGYFVYSIGLEQLTEGISRIGLSGSRRRASRGG